MFIAIRNRGVPMTAGNPRRYESDRRGRIIETAVNVLAEHGVAGITHRKVAEAADVPLGSMTYHFSGIDDLVTAAFRQFSLDTAAYYQHKLEEARSKQDAQDAVVELACNGVWQQERNMILLLELYAYMARKPLVRGLVADWMAITRRALEQHFDAQTARSLDVMLEGVVIQRYIRPELFSVAEVRTMVCKLSNQSELTSEN